MCRGPLTVDLPGFRPGFGFFTSFICFVVSVDRRVRNSRIISLRVDASAATGFNDRKEDGTALSGLGFAD